MKKIKIAAAGLLIIFLFSLPAVADAHWRYGGGLFWGFGAGLLTGYLFAPRPVYVAPPVYGAPPEGYIPAPPPPNRPPEYGYRDSTGEAAPPPSAQGKCREWRLIDRHLEDRWDPYYGRWRQVPVEKWGWAEVPCNN